MTTPELTLDDIRALVELGDLTRAEELIEHYEAFHGAVAADPLWDEWHRLFREMRRSAS